MQLKILGSNSQGNCYLLIDSFNNILIIECGINCNLIKKGIDFKIDKVCGCIITHNHLDHCLAAKDLVKSGIDIYSGDKTLENIGLSKSHRAKPILPLKEVSIGPFRVIPFDVKHDAIQPFGFLIQHPEMGICLFATDTYYLEHTFPGLNQVIIEANYASDILERSDKVFLQNRVMQSHMSLDTCKSTLQANDLTNVQNIVLIHLSNSNADGKRFKSEIEAVTGKRVHVAKAGLTIENFNINPF